MSAPIWIKISGCTAIVVGLAGLVACTVTTTSSGGDGGTAFPTGDSGGGGTDSGGTKSDAGGGACTIAPITIASASCTACGESMCCAEINACLKDDDKCRTFAECIEGCAADAGGPRDDAGVTPCEKKCLTGQTNDTLSKYDDWAAKCIAVKCKTPCGIN